MKYRATCLTPVHVGDGRKLSPIDYMVWKNQVSVLDQNRIFRLLSKGPRLDGYLEQLKKASKLDFASWGGFAQNFAGRRVPFEDPAYAAYWERASSDVLSIATFAAGASGPYLPATALKGALRTGVVFASWKANTGEQVAAKFETERVTHRLTVSLEEHLLGGGGADRMRVAGASDSAVVPVSQFKIYLTRVATLQAARNATQGNPAALTLGWKTAGRSNAAGARPEDSTPTFVEMATPGTAFEGTWMENAFFQLPEVRKALRWGGKGDKGESEKAGEKPGDRAKLFTAANNYAAKQLEMHAVYAERSGLRSLSKETERLRGELERARAEGSCLLAMGWGTGFAGKAAWLDSEDPNFRKAIGGLPYYQRAIQSGLPFPKTRRIVFLENQPATLAGWVRVDVE